MPPKTHEPHRRSSTTPQRLPDELIAQATEISALSAGTLRPMTVAEVLAAGLRAGLGTVRHQVSGERKARA